MKIIQNGQSKRMKCPTCQCIFEYDTNDVKHINGMTFLNSGTDVIYCPQCRERIDEKIGLAVNGLGHLK